MEHVILSRVHATGLSGFFDSLRARYAAYQVYRQTVRELNALGDRGLTDLGISRAMIPSLARETAYGK